MDSIIRAFKETVFIHQVTSDFHVVAFAVAWRELELEVTRLQGSVLQGLYDIEAFRIGRGCCGI